MSALVDAIKKFRSGKRAEQIEQGVAQIFFGSEGMQDMVGMPMNEHTLMMVQLRVVNNLKNYCRATGMDFDPGRFEHVAHDDRADYYSYSHPINIDTVERPGMFSASRGIIPHVTGYAIYRDQGTLSLKVNTNINLIDSVSCGVSNTPQVASARDAVNSAVKNNLLIKIKTRANDVLKNITPEEAVAIETLRSMISETEFRHYIKYGFIIVRGQSDKVYQVFRGRQHTVIWQRGRLIAEACINLKSDKVIPPTDYVIARKIMIETDENMFTKSANIYTMNGGSYARTDEAEAYAPATDQGLPEEAEAVRGGRGYLQAA